MKSLKERLVRAALVMSGTRSTSSSAMQEKAQARADAAVAVWREASSRGSRQMRRANMARVRHGIKPSYELPATTTRREDRPRRSRYVFQAGKLLTQ